MPTENEFQTRIIKSIRIQGGYGRKWSSSLQVGPPDLILSHEAMGGTVFMEVKRFANVKANFHRNVETTEKQRDELEKLYNAGSRVCVGVVLPYKITRCLLAIMPWDTEKFAESEVGTKYPVTQWKSNIGFDVLSLFNPMPSWTAKSGA